MTNGEGPHVNWMILAWYFKTHDVVAVLSKRVYKRLTNTRGFGWVRLLQMRTVVTVLITLG